ncbi:tRNA(Met) cytidine acetyltransferase TmcA domain-containing protein [Marinomonas epiphytica]
MSTALFHRHCYLVTGPTDSIFYAFQKLSHNFGEGIIYSHDEKTYDSLIYSKPHSNTLLTSHRFKQVKQELGASHDAILVDFTQGLSLNALAVLAGTVRGGGIFVIAIPDNWHQHEDLELARYLPWPLTPNQVSPTSKLWFEKQLRSCSSPFKPITSSIPSHSRQPPETFQRLTDCQTKAKNSFFGNSNANYVLIAPRGRGKSTLIGECMAELALAGEDIVLCAANQGAICALKLRFHQICPDFPLPFYAPDALIQSNKKPRYLFIDEAATIPLPMLKALAEKAQCCLFSTTDYGYEGAGKGFGLRFCHDLSNGSKALYKLNLYTPIRWAPNDPLEAWVNENILLNPVESNTDNVDGNLVEAMPVLANQRTLNMPVLTNHLLTNQSRKSMPIPLRKSMPVLLKGEPVVAVMNGADWLSQETRLKECFQLLLSAHYQTSPENLRWMLDDPSVFSSLLSFQKDHQIRSVAVVSKEGQLPQELSRAVAQGVRRPRGHLLPQSLLAHEGYLEAGDFSYWRISRIATQFDRQGTGLASLILQNLEQLANSEQIDFLSTSFAVTAKTLQFWTKNGFQPVRLGTTCDQASGSYSIMMVKPLTEGASQSAQKWTEYYWNNLAINLKRDYQDLESEVKSQLYQAIPTFYFNNTSLTQKDTQDLQLFIEHHRPYLTVRAQLTRLFVASSRLNLINQTDKAFQLLEHLTTTPSSKTDFTQFGLMSKKQAELFLKKTTLKLLNGIEQSKK